MDTFIKGAALVLVAAVLCLVLAKRDKEIALLLCVCTCCLVLAHAVDYLEPVFRLFRQLQTLGNLDGDMMNILLKSVGIGLLGEITGMICSDMGNSALGKGLHVLASAVILWLSLPLITGLMDLVTKILSEL